MTTSLDPQARDWLPSAEATELLGVKAATLYSYVSRGLVRRVPAADGRGNRYARADLLRLKGRSQARGGHAAVAADALRWGQPVVDTQVGGITEAGPIYRGARAVDLVREGVTFEAVADRLLGVEPTRWDLLGAAGLRDRRGAEASTCLDRMLAALAAAGHDDPQRWVPGREGPRARRILGVLASTLPGLARAPRPALDVTLTLVADHGMAASTLAARVAASTGADLYSCVLAGLATLSGPRHGGAGARVEALLAECARLGATVALRQRLARGETLPGFGHPLYRDGDPRCGPLLELAEELAPDAPYVAAALELERAAADVGYERPNLDLGLVAATHALGLGEGESIGLFALGRAAGWMAHAVEQQATGELLRPRARYVGPAPADKEAQG